MIRMELREGQSRSGRGARGHIRHMIQALGGRCTKPHPLNACHPGHSEPHPFTCSHVARPAIEQTAPAPSHPTKSQPNPASALLGVTTDPARQGNFSVACSAGALLLRFRPPLHTGAPASGHAQN